MGGAGEGWCRERGDACGENGTAVHVLCLGFGVVDVRGGGDAEAVGRNRQHARDLAQHADVVRAPAAFQAAHLGLVIAQGGGDVLLRTPLQYAGLTDHFTDPSRFAVLFGHLCHGSSCRRRFCLPNRA